MRFKYGLNIKMFSSRFDAMVDRHYSKLVLPEWMIQACDDNDRLFTAMVENSNERIEHCYFKVLDNNGKCIANCGRQLLKKPGIIVDCIGIESLTTKQHFKKLDSGRKLH